MTALPACCARAGFTLGINIANTSAIPNAPPGNRLRQTARLTLKSFARSDVPFMRIADVIVRLARIRLLL
jgi:hypothetical protein